jgi:NAD(P)-dependent dehydrogenase (short-subunit alcohol dehydrogenase family)
MDGAMTMLKGNVALVTGASRGIGRGTAIGLAREGATVVVAARALSPKTLVKEWLHSNFYRLGRAVVLLSEPKIGEHRASVGPPPRSLK